MDKGIKNTDEDEDVRRLESGAAPAEEHGEGVVIDVQEGNLAIPLA